MPFSWKVVGNTGYDVEEVENPRTQDATCPSCERLVRFVEKQLVKNLRVFGVPLVGVEPGRRVFECPRCGVCVEALPGGGEREQDNPAVADLAARLAKLEDEVWLWSGRAEMAEKHGDTDLAAEALQWKRRAEREVAALRTQLERERTQARSDTAAPAIVARAGGAVVDARDESDFQALKRKLASPKTESAPSETATDAKPVEATATTPPGATTEPSQTPTATAPTSAPTATPEEEFAALKERFKTRTTEASTATTEGAYEALKREMTDRSDAKAPAQADVPPAAREEPRPPPSDDDPLADLKKKLKPR